MAPDNQPLLRTLAPALRELERRLRGWLSAKRRYPVTTLQRATLEGLADLVRPQSLPATLRVRPAGIVTRCAAMGVDFAMVVVLALLFARQVNALQHTAAEPTQTPAAVKVSSR